MEIFVFLLAPLAASLILTGIHAYLGVHVVERGVIFVDLALAQIAALGAIVALIIGLDPHGPSAYWISPGSLSWAPSSSPWRSQSGPTSPRRPSSASPMPWLPPPPSW